jgi:type IV pilus assembly protein PilE
MNRIFPRLSGFHLIEILTTVAIVGILATLCIPLYSQYMVYAKRLEAANMLSQLAIAMEQFHVAHNTYENASLAALHFSETVGRGDYRLGIKTASNNDYLLVAVPIGGQASKDQQCGILMLDANDKKSITGTGNVNECW